MFVLVVSVKVKPDKDRQFLAAIQANVASSRREEAGCRRFDVVRDNADPHHYLLYEVYDDEAAFGAHRTSRRGGGPPRNASTSRPTWPPP